MSFGPDSIKQITRELVNLSKKNLVACYYEKKAVSGTATGLSSIPAEATFAVIKLESNKVGVAVRILETGTNPLVTATDGMGLADGDTWDIHGYQNLVNFRCIEAQAGTNTLHVEYFK